LSAEPTNAQRTDAAWRPAIGPRHHHYYRLRPRRHHRRHFERAAEANVNILDISQSVIREFFTMIMMVDLAGSAIAFHALSDRLTRKGQELSVRVEIQREEIFKAMHRV
jgi:ACT domain-containing protein